MTSDVFTQLRAAIDAFNRATNDDDFVEFDNPSDGVTYLLALAACELDDRLRLLEAQTKDDGR